MLFKTTDSAQQYPSAVTEAYKQLILGEGPSKDWLGWMTKPAELQKSKELRRICAIAEALQPTSDIVHIGAGGSIVGAECLDRLFTSKFNNGTPTIHYTGNTLSSLDIADLLAKLSNSYSIALTVYSKSGKTVEITETTNLIYELLCKKYGKRVAEQHVFAITGKSDSVLLDTAKANHWNTELIIQDNIGGRYGLMQPPVLLPAAVRGIDISELISGAAKAQSDFFDNPCNIAMQYASFLVTHHGNGKIIPYFAMNCQRSSDLLTWLLQLWGESISKNRVWGIPNGGLNSGALHYNGVGQQEAISIYGETQIRILPKTSAACTRFETLNNIMMDSALEAHRDGGTPCAVFELSLTPFEVAYFMQTQLYACAITGYATGVDPTEQEGVEAYKRIMRDKLKQLKN